MRKALEGWRGGMGSTLQHVLYAGASAAAGQLDQALAVLDEGLAVSLDPELRIVVPRALASLLRVNAALQIAIPSAAEATA